ncbi:MAG: tetratricopeptide repeat protein, partial [Mariprofundaceae bacterium]
MNHSFLRVIIVLFLMMIGGFASASEIPAQTKTDMQAGRDAAASIALQSLIKQNPRDYQAWFLFGVAQAKQKHFHQAIEAFQRVIELKPELAEPHNNLAVIYNELNDLKTAIKELEQSLKKLPNNA